MLKTTNKTDSFDIIPSEKNNIIDSTQAAYYIAIWTGENQYDFNSNIIAVTRSLDKSEIGQSYQINELRTMNHELLSINKNLNEKITALETQIETNILKN